MDRLNIERLKNRYRMGGTPIREALNRLVSERFVEALPLKGFRVASMSRAQINDIMQTRHLMESDMLSRALRLGDDDWESQVVGSYHRFGKFERQADFFAKNELTPWLERQTDFLQETFRGCDSAWSCFVHESLVRHTHRYQYLIFQQRTLKNTMLNQAVDYQPLMTAIIDRDSVAANEVLDGLFEQAMGKIKDEWDENVDE